MAAVDLLSSAGDGNGPVANGTTFCGVLIRLVSIGPLACSLAGDNAPNPQKCPNEMGTRCHGCNGMALARLIARRLQKVNVMNNRTRAVIPFLAALLAAAGCSTSGDHPYAHESLPHQTA